VDARQPIWTQRVLILITGQMDVPGYRLAKEGMQASFDRSPDFQIEYSIEYMDRSRLKDAAFGDTLLDLYRTKYAERPSIW
jgi:hypothetical protein